MTVLSRTKKALTMLLSVGVLGISSALASTNTGPLLADRRGDRRTASVAERLREIRTGVSEVEVTEQKELSPDGGLVAWVNFGGLGWRNGGWGNGGWRNGGWGNGGWHNGGWHNGGWGNGGWHNWHNFWHNW